MSSFQDWINQNVVAPIFDATGNVLGWVASEAAQYGVATPSQAAEVANGVGNTIGTLYTGSTNVANAVQGTTAQGLTAAYDSAGRPIGLFVQSTLLPLMIAALFVAGGFFLMTEN